MVLCRSMNAGSVVGIPRGGGTLKPYLMHLQMVGMQKHWMEQLTPEPPGESFRNIFFGVVTGGK